MRFNKTYINDYLLSIAWFILLLVLASVSGFSQNQQKGKLVIVGGGLEASNEAVYTEMIQLAGGAESASFAVIPVAGGYPVQSFQLFRNTLIHYGVKSENIRLIQIALVDDDSTTLVDESLWKDNAMNAAEAEKVRLSSAVWFTGGDQLRTTRALVQPDGSNSLVLDAVWEVYNNGGVVAGSSAGAAIMSKIMIGRGASFNALTMDTIARFDEVMHDDSDTLFVTKGLGFFPLGIVDQHFDKRGRIGRLVVAAMQQKESYSLAFGIDENTALIYLPETNEIKVAGASGVTILDVSSAEMTQVKSFKTIKNLDISYLQQGDRFDFLTRSVLPDLEKKAIAETDKQAAYQSFNSGIFAPFEIEYNDIISKLLIRNGTQNFIENINLINNHEAYMMRFEIKPQSKAFKFKRNITSCNLKLDIYPIYLKVSGIN